VTTVIVFFRLDAYRTVMERPRSICFSSCEREVADGGGPRWRKWCFKPGTRDERTSNHFADRRVRMTPLVGMPFWDENVLNQSTAFHGVVELAAKSRAYFEDDVIRADTV
jgi:hypothetical protein